jgi:hypothetical protein
LLENKSFEVIDNYQELESVNNRQKGNGNVSGYLHWRYAGSLSEFGKPRQLKNCGGWILERQVPGLTLSDGMGSYPLFVCQDWQQLHLDLDILENELISLALVTDPFGNYDEPYLRKSFKDIVFPFKNHFVADLHKPLDEIVSRHHNHYVKKALRNVEVEDCQEPMLFFEDWLFLYDTLIKKHHLNGIKAFSRRAFYELFNVPGLVMLRALYHGQTVGAQLWITKDNVGYGHLGAYSELGYKLGASYAVYWYAIKYFSDKLRWLDWGGGAGASEQGGGGLSQFKQGWSTGERTAYFCGRIFQYDKYSEIVQSKGIGGTNYFPAYRKGEFG